MNEQVAIQAVVLSGGSGSRLWPASRKNRPKQFLPLNGSKTLFSDCLARCASVSNSAPIIVANEEHRFLVAEEMRMAKIDNPEIILEPEGRNTAAAIVSSALRARESGRDPILLICPSDHVFGDSDEFSKTIENGSVLANKGKIVLLGVEAASPETGYGYIEVDSEDSSDIARFIEKPDYETAEKYCESPLYFWNCGVFMARASVWLDQAKQYLPEVYASCERAWNTKTLDGDFVRLGVSEFLNCPSVSIDKGLLERTDAISIVYYRAFWSDLGVWSSFWKISEKDENGNSVTGRAEMLDSSNNLVRSGKQLVSIIGCSNLAVIVENDAILVTDMNCSQQVKNLVESLDEKDHSEVIDHSCVYRPWGNYESVDQGERYQVKRIVVNPGATLSLQMHHHRSEHWIVAKGTAIVTCDDKEILLTENQSTYIPLGATHRLENPGSIPLELIEIQSGSYLGEDDIVRLEDKYGRIEESHDVVSKMYSSSEKTGS